MCLTCSMPCWYWWLPVDSYQRHWLTILTCPVPCWCWWLPVDSCHTVLADIPYLFSSMLMLMTACWQLPYSISWYSLSVQFHVDVDDCLLTATIQHQLIFFTSSVSFCTSSLPCWCWWLPVDSYHTAPACIPYLFSAMLILMTACWQLPYRISWRDVHMAACWITWLLFLTCSTPSSSSSLCSTPCLREFLGSAVVYGVGLIVCWVFAYQEMCEPVCCFIRYSVLSRSTVSVQAWAETVFLSKHRLNTLESILIECCLRSNTVAQQQHLPCVLPGAPTNCVSPTVPVPKRCCKTCCGSGHIPPWLLQLWEY